MQDSWPTYDCPTATTSSRVLEFGRGRFQTCPYVDFDDTNHLTGHNHPDVHMRRIHGRPMTVPRPPRRRAYWNLVGAGFKPAPTRQLVHRVSVSQRLKPLLSEVTLSIGFESGDRRLSSRGAAQRDLELTSTKAWSKVFISATPRRRQLARWQRSLAPSPGCRS